MKTRRANREKYVNQRTTYPCNTRVQKAGAYQDSYGMRQKQHCLCQNHSKNGGILENGIESEGKIEQRYWITL